MEENIVNRKSALKTTDITPNGGLIFCTLVPLQGFIHRIFDQPYRFSNDVSRSLRGIPQKFYHCY